MESNVLLDKTHIIILTNGLTACVQMRLHRIHVLFSQLGEYIFQNKQLQTFPCLIIVTPDGGAVKPDKRK